MKVGLLGQFGSGNSGNDGSLEAMVSFLRTALPDATLLCICSNPSNVRKRFALETLSIRGAATAEGRLFRILNTALGRLPGRIVGLLLTIQSLRGVDVIMIPGTGILDDFQESPFGWPFIIYWWCLAARLRGARIAFVSIGAGPIRGTFSRWLLASAARMAEYRSYRDDYSHRYVKSLGIDVSSDYRYPDIAFGLGEPQGAVPEDRTPTIATVGIGVMHYRGWERGHADADALYAAYLAKITDLLLRLLQKGHAVRVFMGDTSDEATMWAIQAQVDGRTSARRNGAVTFAYTRSLQEVMAEIGKVDIAIVSRYHNLLCALKLGCPTLSLGYAQKNDELMAQFGQQAFCHHIESFAVDAVLEQTQQVLDDGQVVAADITRHNRLIQSQLRQQQQLLLSRLLAA